MFFSEKKLKKKIKKTFHERYTEEEIYYNYTKGSTLKYWIEILGDEEGLKKYQEICFNKGKSNRLDYYIEKYGPKKRRKDL